jgi:hypothetical protein
MISSFETSSPFPPHQQGEQIERSRAERYRRCDTGLIEAEKTAGAAIKPEALKQEKFTRAEPAHALVLPQLSAQPQDIALSHGRM